jgi:IS5 family transposase
MLGRPKKTDPKLFYHGVSLERRMPKEHPLRKIKQLLDFDFIRSQVADLYGINGNQSVDPSVVLKLMFLLFYENIKSERALMRQLPLRMDWLWFCDYDLDEVTPDHSILSKARNRWGTEVFESFFMNILEQCINAGLVDGETIYIDSSTIDGNADINKVRPQLRQLSEQLTDKLDDNPQEKPAKRVSPADTDARIGRKYGKSTLGYKDHRGVDDKHGIITATITTPANVNDDKVLTDVITSHQFKSGTKAKTAVADKGYGTVANYKYLKENNITPCIPHKRHTSSQDADFSSDKFVYDSIGDFYICPAGEKLKCFSINKVKGTSQYRARRKTCQKCEHLVRCVTGKKSGRGISRNLNARYYHWADGCLTKHQRYRLMSRRKYKAEGSFANGANNYGFKRARWRGLDKMNIQNLMIAAIQNLGKLLRYGGADGKLTVPVTSIKSFWECIAVVLCRLLGIWATYERILNYQRAKPV